MTSSSHLRLRSTVNMELLFLHVKNFGRHQESNSGPPVWKSATNPPPQQLVFFLNSINIISHSRLRGCGLLNFEHDKIFAENRRRDLQCREGGNAGKSAVQGNLWGGASGADGPGRQPVGQWRI